MTIGDTCNREVIIISKEASVVEAAKLMRQYHVGDVIVVDEQEGQRVPVGILTDRDIVVEVLADDVPLENVTVGDVMSTELLTAGEDDDIIETTKRMRSKGIRRLPVVNRHGGLVGILAVDDLIDLIAEQMQDLADLIISEQKRERALRRTQEE